MFVFLFSFLWKQIENIFWSWLLRRQLNSLQNDVCLNHVGQKLWEKIHFLQPKVSLFRGKEKHIKTHEYELCVKYIT